MLIGGQASPFREPCNDGLCFVGRSRYQHSTGPELHDKYVNNTAVPNYDASIGGNIPPYARFNGGSLPICTLSTNCPPVANGVPCEPWIGTDQAATSPQYTLVAGQPNTAPQSWAMSGQWDAAVCHKRGFKSVVAKRQWHGTFGFTSKDYPTYSDQCGTVCTCLLCDCCDQIGSDGLGTPNCAGISCINACTGNTYYPTYHRSYFTPYQSTPDQTKYLTLTASGISYTSKNIDTSDIETDVVSAGSGSITVNAQSGERTGSFTTNETDTTIPSGGPSTVTKNISNGYDSVSGTYGNSSIADSIIGTDFHCSANVGVDLIGIIDEWNAGSLGGGALHMCGYDSAGTPDCPDVSSPGNLLPQPTNPNGYSASQSINMPIYEDDGPGNCVTLGYTVANITISWTRTNTSFTWNYSLELYQTGPSGGAYTPTGGYTYSKTTSSGTITLSNPNTAANVKTDLETLLGEWDLSDDAQYPWRIDPYVTTAPKVYRLEPGQSVSPIGFFPTVFDYTNPINDSSGNAPFTSGWVTSGGNWAQRGWFDPNTYQWQFAAGQSNLTAGATGLVQIYDGSIQGAPKPAGYQGFWQYDFIAWSECCESGSSVQWYINSYLEGVGAVLPQNSTGWLNNYELVNHPQTGAFMQYGIADGDLGDGACSPGLTTDTAFYARKWAECGETYQSCNFGRPGGADKFAYDETDSSGNSLVFCVASNTAGVVTLQTPSGGTPVSLPYTTADIVGGSSIGGFFAVAAVVANAVTLGAQMYNIPSDWAANLPSGDATTAFGRLRFPGAPSLLGRIAVTAIADSISRAPFTIGWTPTYQFATAQTDFAMAVAGTDQIDIWSSSMSSLASNVAATRVSDTVFNLATAVANAGYVTIHGAPAYQYVDNYPKGDFIWLTWLADRRTNGEVTRLNDQVDCSGNTPPSGSPTDNYGYASFSQTADCLGETRCAPRVVCFSPNGEVFKNGKTYGTSAGGWPTTFAADEKYGSRWQAVVQWSMTDPFWQKPHMPCTFNGAAFDGAWTEDNGTCQTSDSDTAYYPLAPMVEARLTVPSGFPALPGGITLGWLSPVTNDTGDVAYPPGPTGYSAGGVPNLDNNTPWAIQLALCGHLNCMGYANWVLNCNY